MTTLLRVPPTWFPCHPQRFMDPSRIHPFRMMSAVERNPYLLYDPGDVLTRDYPQLSMEVGFEVDDPHWFEAGVLFAIGVVGMGTFALFGMVPFDFPTEVLQASRSCKKLPENENKLFPPEFSIMSSLPKDQLADAGGTLCPAPPTRFSGIQKTSVIL